MKNWTSTLNDISKQSLSEFGSLTSEQLNWKPASNTWSIAQNLDHLIVVNETYYPVLAFRLNPEKNDSIIVPHSITAVPINNGFYRYKLISNPTLS